MATADRALKTAIEHYAAVTRTTAAAAEALRAQGVTVSQAGVVTPPAPAERGR